VEDAFDGQDAVEGVVLEWQLTCVAFDPGNVVAVGGIGLGLGSSELARVDVQASEVHVGMSGVDLLDGSAESAPDVQQTLPVCNVACLQQHGIHLLHGREVVGSRTHGGLRVFPIAPVHLVFPQLPGLATVLPFVDKQVKVGEVRHLRKIPRSGLASRAAPRSVAVGKSVVPVLIEPKMCAIPWVDRRRCSWTARAAPANYLGPGQSVGMNSASARIINTTRASPINPPIGIIVTQTTTQTRSLGHSNGWFPTTPPRRSRRAW